MKQPQSITIVGGGAAGWMTAIYLNRYFNQHDRAFQITVVESKDIGIIGVGEATVHSLRYFFAAMGLDERELLRATQGTLKSGILFRNWMKPVRGETHEYFHPFEANFSGSHIDISSAWFASGCPGGRYDKATCTSAHLIDEGYCAKGKNSRPYEGLVPYGYHLDAMQLARFLRHKAVEAGVVHIEATVSEVNTAHGQITSVNTDKGEIGGDFFVDCTGFSALLINSLNKDNWHSFEDVLPCNRAVAIQKPYCGETDPHPYTLATALTNGWAWQIDLVNRQGTGYVYDGNRLTEAQAEQELRDFISADEHSRKAVHLKMHVGRREAFWTGNCIAMGLAGGFIEPLESTGLHVINIGARLMATHLSAKDYDQTLRDSYNSLMCGVYEDLKQFIVLHYCLTDRDDTAFWQQAQQSAGGCPGLKDKLALWRHKVCEYLDLAGSYATTFTDENYRYVLYGMQHYPQVQLSLDPAQTVRLQARLEQKRQQIKQQAMHHRDYLVAVGG